MGIVHLGDGRSRCRSDCFISEIFDGDEQIHLRNLQQGFPKGPELAAAQERAQPAMEAETKNEQRSSEEEGVYMPGEELCTP